MVGNIFYIDAKDKLAENKKALSLQNTVDNMFGTNNKSEANLNNPFLNKNGELFNPLLNYQKLLDNPKISQRAKNYISQATGLTSTLSKANSSPEPQKPQAITTEDGVTPSSNQTQTTKTSSSGNAIADAAQKYSGTPYVWGGDSISDGGMDCSGFVYNALKDAGKNVGRTTAEGYRQGGTPVSKDNLQPGDLVFYGSGSATHVGVYMGNGQIMHSSGGSKNTQSNPGKGVTTTTLDHRSDYLGAVRY